MRREDFLQNFFQFILYQSLCFSTLFSVRYCKLKRKQVHCNGGQGHRNDNFDLVFVVHLKSRFLVCKCVEMNEIKG